VFFLGISVLLRLTRHFSLAAWLRLERRFTRPARFSDQPLWRWKAMVGVGDGKILERSGRVLVAAAVANE